MDDSLSYMSFPPSPPSQRFSAALRILNRPEHSASRNMRLPTSSYVCPTRRSFDSAVFRMVYLRKAHLSSLGVTIERVCTDREARQPIFREHSGFAMSIETEVVGLCRLSTKEVSDEQKSIERALLPFFARTPVRD